jgi:hypothetical protein
MSSTTLTQRKNFWGNYTRTIHVCAALTQRKNFWGSYTRTVQVFSPWCSSQSAEKLLRELHAHCPSLLSLVQLSVSGKTFEFTQRKNFWGSYTRTVQVFSPWCPSLLSLVQLSFEGATRALSKSSQLSLSGKTFEGATRALSKSSLLGAALFWGSYTRTVQVFSALTQRKNFWGSYTRTIQVFSQRHHSLESYKFSLVSLILIFY